ncbi:MAG: glycosyltransferase family 1 protein [Candidatus Daviesbacteria bacterium]|nr:glycosyltransferase family 1 protein [Candidatus Daviesbacteria bacterium]
MIVGFDGSRAFEKVRTGTEEYSYQLLKNLAKIDEKNIYKVFIRPNSKVEGDWPENFQFIKIDLPRFWTQVGLATKTFFEDLDVLFVPAHTLPIIYRPGLKTVVTVHDLGSEYLPKTHQLKQRLYLGLMQRYQLKKATHIIAVSNATKNDLVNKIKLPSQKIGVVYEGFDENLFKPVKSDQLRDTLKYYGIEKERYFLFVGTVQPRKNLERLIRAFSLLKLSRAADLLSVRGPAGSQPHSMSSTSLRALIGAPRSPSPLTTELVIVGKKGWLSDEIYDLPKKLGIENRVKFLDYVKREDLPALYSGALALTYPSLYEGFGLPILEAQACGCPVITSKISSMPEVVGKGGILVNPLSVDDIVKGMEKCQISNVKSQMIKAGFENVKKFSWEKCAKETLKVLEEVANE